MLHIWIETIATMVRITRFQLRESLTDELVNVTHELCNYKLSLEYVI